jgi:2-methylisocitrate lyase-like PEP mutase family enzyme
MQTGKSKARQLRQLLAAPDIVVAPGVFDCFSARLVESMGFSCAITSGSAISNAKYGQPDAGFMMREGNVDTSREIARAVSIPVTADADTGYGNAVSVYHTVQLFEEAGIVGVNLEDQVWPKRCGHMRGKELISDAEAAKKIEAAVAARHDPDFVIIARTDALAVEGIEGAIRRGRLYAKAGADLIFPDAIRSADDIARIVDEVGIPVTVNMGFGIRPRPTTPLLGLRELRRLGVKRISLPRMLPAAAIMGMRKALEAFKQSMATGEPADRPDLAVSMADMMALMNYPGLEALEKRFTTEEVLQRQYGPKGQPAYMATAPTGPGSP